LWAASPALALVDPTVCDGVVVGGVCLGRPGLFADLTAAFAGPPERVLPPLGVVAAVLRRHAELLVDWFGSEQAGCTDVRKHVAWYLKGFSVGSALRRSLAMVSSLSELDDLLGKLDPGEPFPLATLGQPRGRTNSPGTVALPEGWLASRDELAVPEGAELDDSGG
jgi:tRNA-dihydrouridine synthase